MEQNPVKTIFAEELVRIFIYGIENPYYVEQLSKRQIVKMTFERISPAAGNRRKDISAFFCFLFFVFLFLTCPIFHDLQVSVIRSHNRGRRP